MQELALELELVEMQQVQQLWWLKQQQEMLLQLLQVQVPQLELELVQALHRDED